MCTLHRSGHPRPDFECGNKSSKEVIEKLFRYIHSVYSDVCMVSLPSLTNDNKYQFALIGYALGKTQLDITVYNQE